MFLTENPFSDHGPSKKVQESIGKTAGDKSYYHLQRAKALAKKDGHDYDKLPKYDRAKPHQDQYHDMAKKESVKNEAFKYHIPEDIPANERTAFHGAAADAAKKGKKSFNFGGKTHPVTMKKDTANKIADQKEAVKYPHMMYDPKTGKEVTAKTPMDHAKFSKMGYTHEKPKMNEISKKTAANYIGKASRDAYFKGRDQGTVDAISAVGGSHPQQDYKKSPERKAAMRMRGIDRATKRLAKSEGTEMSIREKLMSLYEGDRAAHYKSATPPEEYDEKSKSSKGAMDMLNTPKSTEADGMKAAKDTADSIKKSAPGKKLRKADKNTGDLAIKPSATPVKDPAAKMQTAESTVNEDQAYHKAMAAAHGHHGERHSTEAGNSDSSGHDYAANAHDEAERLHKVAHDAHKKHGGDSKQYKSAADAAHKQSAEAHDNTKDAGRFKAIDKPSMKMFPKKPSMTKEDYGISGNKVSDALLDAIEQVTKEASIKGSGTDRKAILKKAFRAGEKQDQSAFTGKKPAIRAPKGMKGRMKSGKMDAFSAKHKDKGIEKAYQAGFHGDHSGNKPEKGKARMKPQSNLPRTKDQRIGLRMRKRGNY